MDEDELNRLRAHADLRPVAIPDTEGEVLGALDGLDKMFGMAAPDEDDPEDDGVVITEAARRAGRDALGRLCAAVSAAESGPAAQPLAPDGYQLVPLSWAHVETADLTQLGLAVQALGRAWAVRSDEPIVDALESLAENSHRRPEDLVAEAARLHGLLSLPWDDSVTTLFAVLPRGAGRVVLAGATHAAYQQLVDRILGIWHAGDHLAPYLYRGR